MNKNNLALVFLALVAVIALVGLVLIGTTSISGQVTEDNILTGFAPCGGTTAGNCPQGQNCVAVGSTRVGWRTRPVFGCRGTSPKPVTPPPQRKCGVESYRLGPQRPTPPPTPVPPPLYTSASWKCYGRPQVTRPGLQPARNWESMSRNECANACVVA